MRRLVDAIWTLGLSTCFLAPCLLGGCGEEKSAAPPGGPVTEAGPRTSADPAVSSTAGPSTSASSPSPKPKVERDAADEEERPRQPADDEEDDAPKDKAGPTDLDQACPAADGDAPGLKLAKIQLTSNVEDKQPVDELSEVHPGQKLWAYLEVGSETDDRCVAVTFRFGGRKRATLTLDIGRSPRWRTWANVTASKTDVGKKAEVVVTDDQGNELHKTTIPVVEGSAQPAGG